MTVRDVHVTRRDARYARTPNVTREEESLIGRGIFMLIRASLYFTIETTCSTKLRDFLSG